MKCVQDRVVRCIGTVLAGMYLVLGLAFVILFILVNMGKISDEQLVVNLYKSYVLLAVILVILFIGFLTSIMIIVSIHTNKNVFILPWLVFHLLSILVMVIGGTALLLHFIVNEKQLKRATICSIPIVTGIMLMFIWVKVYQQMFYIKIREKKRKTAKMYEIFKNTYLAFNPNLEQNISIPHQSLQSLQKTYNIYSVPHESLTEADLIKEKIAAHEYKDVSQLKEAETPKSLTLVQTKKDKTYPPVYFYGDPFGFLTWRDRCRTFETLEASVIFDVEDEEYLTEDSTRQECRKTKESLLQHCEKKEDIPTIPDVNILKDKRKGYTKEEIVNIYCNLQDI